METALKLTLKNGIFEGLTTTHSRRMAAVRGKSNRTTELALRMALVRHRISGWTLHATNLPGRPDFYFSDERVSVFVDGCFWHGCKKCGHVPRRNNPYWSAKLLRNRQRDQANNKRLRSKGIRVVRFWEHELKNSDLCLRRLLAVTRNPI